MISDQLTWSCVQQFILIIVSLSLSMINIHHLLSNKLTFQSPIFLSVFYPTITPEGFTTEVYHLNGEGEEAGVVYSEMQGVENTSENLMLLRCAVLSLVWDSVG